MHFTLPFVSLLLAIPLALANPVSHTTCGKDIQSKAIQAQIQAQTPIHAALTSVPNMEYARPANEPDTTGRGRGRQRKVKSIECSGRRKRCVARVNGRRWKAIWRLRSIKRRLIDGGEDDSEDFQTMGGGRLALASIKCDRKARPQVCRGRLNTGHIATWVARIPAPYLTDPESAEEDNLLEELEDMTAAGDFDGEVSDIDEAEYANDEEDEEDLHLSEDDDQDIDLEDNNATNEVDEEEEEELFEFEADEDDDNASTEPLEEQDASMAPVRVRALACNGRRRVCKASLLSQGLVAKWNVRIRRPHNW